MTTMANDFGSAPEFERLAVAAKGGEGGSRERLLARLRPRLVAWARGLTGEPDAAEDLAQEAMLRVDRSLEGFEVGGFLPWSYRILLNLQRDRSRTVARRRSILAAAADELPVPGRPGPDPSEAVRAFLADLSPQQRAVFQLVDLEGWSFDEVAAALDVTPSTARVHLHRARRTIRARILEETA